MMHCKMFSNYKLEVEIIKREYIFIPRNCIAQLMKIVFLFGLFCMEWYVNAILRRCIESMVFDGENQCISKKISILTIW